MSRERHEDARRAALWLIYILDLTDGDAFEILRTSRKTLRELEPDIDDYFGLVEERVRGVAEHWDELTDAIQEVSPRWKVGRMAHVDRNLLRLGAWEILHSDIPPIVSINACVELAKEYGEKTTPGFVNGLLDELCTARSIAIE